jgi:hypothetical protein
MGKMGRGIVGIIFLVSFVFPAPIIDEFDDGVINDQLWNVGHCEETQGWLVIFNPAGTAYLSCKRAFEAPICVTLEAKLGENNAPHKINFGGREFVFDAGGKIKCGIGTLTEIGEYVSDEEYEVRIEIESASVSKFYLGGTLKHTATTTALTSNLRLNIICPQSSKMSIDRIRIEPDWNSISNLTWGGVKNAFK